MRCGGRNCAFEPSTEVIRKGKAGKPNEFGKMIKLQEAENQIIIDYEVYARRPSDRDLLIPAIQTHQAKLGRVPRLVATDGGFYSARNEAAAKAMRVKRARPWGGGAWRSDQMCSDKSMIGWWK